MEIGARFEILVRPIDERCRADEAPRAYARRMAMEKARAAREARPGTWLLAADTVVEIDDQILGKPENPTIARDMLSRLSGRGHRVLTAVTLVGPDETVHLDQVVTSHVRFRSIDAREIDAYVASGEPLDKAGAYAVQGLGGRFVESVDGSFSSVIGLPMEVVRAALVHHALLDT
jgi:septum formation protein